MQVADRVQETSTTTGTGTLTLAGAVSGYQSFASAFPAASTFNIPYCITDASGNWEAGTGTYTLSGTTLSRSPTASSNAGALVSFPAGSKSVFCAMIASIENANSFTYNTSPPANPQVGQRWVDSSAGILYVYIFDGTTNNWVQF